MISTGNNWPFWHPPFFVKASSLKFCKYHLLDFGNVPTHSRLRSRSVPPLQSREYAPVTVKRFLLTPCRLQRLLARFPQHLHQNVYHLQEHAVVGSQGYAVVELRVFFDR